MNFYEVEGLEIVYKDAETALMDNQCTHTFTVRDSEAEFTCTLHSISQLKLSRLGQFNELEFVRVKNMPCSFMEQAIAWHYAIAEICRRFQHVGWLAIRMSHDSDLVDTAIFHGFIPVLDDAGVPMVIRYMAPKLDQKERNKYISSANAQVIEATCFFGPVQLKAAAIPLELATCKQAAKNECLPLLAIRYDKIPLYGISITVDPDKEPVPFIPYFALTKMLQYIVRTDFDSRLIGVVARHRYERQACLEAGFFPLNSDKEDECLFLRYF